MEVVGPQELTTYAAPPSAFLLVVLGTVALLLLLLLCGCCCCCRYLLRSQSEVRYTEIRLPSGAPVRVPIQ